MFKVLLILSLFYSVLAEGAICKDYDQGVIRNYCNQVYNNRGWKLAAEGRSWRKDIWRISLLFNSCQRLNIPEARRVFVLETQRMIELYNKEGRNHIPYSPGPFSIKHLSFALSFRDACTLEHVEYPYVAFVLAVGDTILYQGLDSDNNELIEIHKEPYAEALRIVQEETD